MRLVVGITGATGAPLGVRLVQCLAELPHVETHLIVSRWARKTISLETDWTANRLCELADVVYSPEDQCADVSSGSFHTDGMVVMPCSMKTLAGIRAGYSHELIGRAADVTLKERRPLVLVARETPLSVIHLDNMLALARAGAQILPPMLTFYNQPQTLDDMVEHIVARVLDQFGLPTPGARRWGDSPATSTDNRPQRNRL